MPKLSKSGLFKTMGVGAASTPAIGAAVYGFSKQTEFQTLKNTISEQKKKIDILEAKPEAIQNLQMVKKAEDTDKQNKKLEGERNDWKQKYDELETQKTTQYNNQQQQINELKKELNNLKAKGNDKDFTQMAKYVCKFVDVFLQHRWGGNKYPVATYVTGFSEWTRYPIVVWNFESKKPEFYENQSNYRYATVEEHRNWAQSILPYAC